MKTEEAVKRFGSKYRIAQILNITRQAVGQWGDEVPELQAFRLEKLRSNLGYVTAQDIVIPAGTKLHPSPNQRAGYVEAIVGFGNDFTGYLVVQPHADALASGYFEEMVK